MTLYDCGNGDLARPLADLPVYVALGHTWCMGATVLSGRAFVHDMIKRVRKWKFSAERAICKI